MAAILSRRSPMREPQAESDTDESARRRKRDGLGEDERAEQRGGERAQRQEGGDVRRRRVAERPEPEHVADTAAHADEDDRDPAAARESRPVREEALADGER